MPLSNYHAIEKNLCAIEGNALVRLVCVSHKAWKVSETIWLGQVYQDYCAFNQSNDIKGFSCKGGNYFFQCLEGMKQSVLCLMVKIFADKRHKGVKVILSEPITHCGFKVWQIHCVNLDHIGGADTAIGLELQQYLPFKPKNWPAWYIEYFVETIQKFDGVGIADSHQHHKNPLQRQPYAHNHASSNYHAPPTQQATVPFAPSILTTVARAISRQLFLILVVLIVLILVLLLF